MAATAYDDCVIAYIDVLGFTDLVRNDKVGTILTAMRTIRNRLHQLDDIPNSPLRHTMFSDTVVFSAQRSDDGVVALVHNVAYLAAALFLRGVFCRGAIAKGQLHHRGATIFGPALIEAYRLEGQLAIYPRVIVPLDIAEQFLNAKNQRISRPFHKEIVDFFRHDFDNQYHVDILSPWMSKPPRRGLVSNTVVRPIKRHVLNQIDASEDIETQRKQAKLFWLYDYLEYVEKLHGPVKLG